MLMNSDYPDEWDVSILENDFSGLNEVYREIAEEIGIENTVAIFKLFRGAQITFPGRLFSREYTHRAIIREYNGSNVLQLAQKYNYSQRTVWRILSEAGKNEQEENEL